MWPKAYKIFEGIEMISIAKLITAQWQLEMGQIQIKKTGMRKKSVSVMNGLTKMTSRKLEANYMLSRSKGNFGLFSIDLWAEERKLWALVCWEVKLN